MPNQANQLAELRALAAWTEFLEWLLATTEKFPKKARFTLTNRIDNLALDLVETLIEARFTRQRQGLIRQGNLILDKLRVLLRLAHKMALVASGERPPALCFVV